MYGMNVATGMISGVADKLIPELKAWQQRPLDSHYPIVWLDAIHYKVKEDGRYNRKVVYTLLGLNIRGIKEILGLHLSGNKGTNYW
jgi:transposase-like protein